MRSRTRTAVVCASVLTAAIGGLGVLAGAGGGGAGGTHNAPAADARRGPEGEFHRVEAEVEFWKQEMRRLESEQGALMGEGGASGSVIKARIELNQDLLRRAAEADQDARLRLHLARWELNRNKPDAKRE